MMAVGAPGCDMTRDDFETLVAEALDRIPDEFARYLENVAVVVEDEPDPDTLRRMGLDPRRDSLYGLYQGVPLKRRPHDFAGLPDHITIYSGPLMRDFSPRQLRRQIEITVVHEVAHFFGLDERTVRRLGY